MNEQQGKHLDQRVRKALNNLPDAPGTEFDAGKLWEQIRPELATQPVAVPGRMGEIRWLVAASLIGIGLFLGWLLRVQPGVDRLQASRQVAGYVGRKNSVQPQKRTWPEQKLPALPPRTGQQVAETQPVSRAKKLIDRPIQTAEATEVQPTLATIDLPADLPVVDLGPAEPLPVKLTPAPVNQKPGIAYPKRRFAVVHQNEVRAEAETRARLERNDRFVRLGAPPPGTSSMLPITPAEEKTGLIIPLH